MEAEIEPVATIQNHQQYNFMYSLLAGGVAGTVVDIALFPIDTLKTRLQSERGFMRSGGFKGVYKGLAPAAAGSAPTAALFFCVYDSCKNYLNLMFETSNSPYIHMASASVAELFACFIRVPVEIAKQRRQAFSHKQHTTAFQILWNAYQTEGLRRGIYRGFGTTVLREIPFSFIQFPLWEFFKHQWSHVTGLESTPFSVALCGAVAGGISAGLTTPLDVAKTRIMLADEGSGRSNAYQVLSSIYRNNGVKGLFAGFLPRVLWITLGGAFFFGFYDLTSRMLIATNTQSNNM